MWIHHVASQTFKTKFFFYLPYYKPQDSFALLRRESPLLFQYAAASYINVQLITVINHQAVLSDEQHDIHEHMLTPASCFGRLRK